MMKRKDKKSNFQRFSQNDPFAVQEGKFRFGKLKDSSYYSGWTEHAFLSDSDNKEVLGQTFDFRQLRVMKLVLLVFFSLILVRISWLQLFQSDYYISLAEGNRFRRETIEAKRGIFYDRFGQSLVRNTANFVLSLRLIDLPRDELERDQVIRQISQILDELPLDDNNSSIITDGPSFVIIKEALGKVTYGSLESYQPIFIKDNIEYNQALKLILIADQLPGVIISNKIRREYPQIKPETLLSLSHVLGYTGKINETELNSLGSSYSLIDYLGKTGLELTWEGELRGQNGWQQYEVDALGRKVKLSNELLAVDGYNLHLALDLELQAKTEEVLLNWLDKLQLDRASVVILDPNNGEILALVSLPAYNNNNFARGISYPEYQDFLQNPSRPLFNRAVSGEYPSGSTIKPIIAAAALEEKVISENSSLLSVGGIWVGQWFFPDWRAGGHGQTNVKKAIAQSVNTFFYYIGGGYQDFTGLGLDRLVSYAHLFGLGEKSGVDLNSEASGLVPTREWKQELKKEPWYIGDTYHFSIGQGDVLTTPLQIVNFIAAIASGTLYQPHLVTKIVSEDGQLIKTIEPQIIRQNFIDNNNLRIVREGMRQTVTAGSAQSLNYLPVAVAGKTGTAQWSSQKAPHAWFAGFAPYEDPEIAFVILVEEGREGSEVSVPIAREILEWYFSQRHQE